MILTVSLIAYGQSEEPKKSKNQREKQILQIEEELNFHEYDITCRCKNSGSFSIIENSKLNLAKEIASVLCPMLQPESELYLSMQIYKNRLIGLEMGNWPAEKNNLIINEALEDVLNGKVDYNASDVVYDCRVIRIYKAVKAN